MRMLHSFALSSCLGLACTSDLPAPTNYGSGDGGELTLDCSAAPAGAVATQLAFTPTLTGGVPSYAWQSDDLPEGFNIDRTTGEVTGTPTAEQPIAFHVEVSDSAGHVAQTICELTVRPTLTLDLDLDGNGVGCASAGERASSFFAEGTGSDADITCTLATSQEGGAPLPDGTTLNAETCTIEGSPQDGDRFGTWVTLMRVTQGGQSVYLPYCMSRAQKPATSFNTLTVEHSGLGSASVTRPLVVRFDPARRIVHREARDPLFTVADLDICDGSSRCEFRLTFRTTSGATQVCVDDPGGNDPCSEVGFNEAALPDRTGFSHTAVFTTAIPVPAALQAHAWVTPLSLDYCLTNVEDACDTPGGFAALANGFLQFGVVFVPES